MVEQTEHKELVPRLRFRGFTEPWRQCKLKDIASFYKGRGFSKADLVDKGIPVLLYGTLYTNYRSIYDNFNTYVSENSIGFNSRRSDIVIPASGETAKDIAIASVVDLDDILLGGDLNVVRLNSNDSPLFVALQITYGKTHLQLAAKAQGKSVVHLHNAEIQESSIFTSSPDEENQISKIFQILDKLITAYERKLTLLKRKKQYFLQAIFSQKLGFKGFTEPWRQCKLGELAKQSLGGGTPKTSVPEYWDGSLPWIQSSDLSEDNIWNVSPRKFISEKGLKNSAAKRIPMNSVAIVSRVGVGKVAVIPFEYATSQDFLSLSELTTDLSFSAYVIQQLIIKIGTSQGTSIKGITKNQIMQLLIDTPSLEEQKRIGDFFKKLDALIAAYERKLTLLRQKKQYFLQNLFA